MTETSLNAQAQDWLTRFDQALVHGFFRGIMEHRFPVVLGRDFAKLRPPIPELMIFGGMMVSRDEIKYLIRPWRSFHAFRLATWRLLEYLVARLDHRRGTRLVLGNALVGRLFHSCRQKGVEIALDARLAELVRNGDHVEGAVVEMEGAPRRIRAPSPSWGWAPFCRR